MATSLSEWQKILFTALAAFAVGILAEPLKMWIGEAFRKRKIRRMCYEQILLVRGVMTSILYLLERPLEPSVSFKGTNEDHGRFAVSNVKLGPLKYALETEPGIIYQLEVYPTISRIVNALEAVPKDIPRDEIAKVANIIVTNIDRDADWGTISAKYLSAVHDERQWDRWRDSPPPEVDVIDKRYRSDSTSLYTFRPFISTNIHRIKRLRARWHNFMKGYHEEIERSKRDTSK